MKKIFLFLLLLILSGCTSKKTLQDLLDEIDLPDETIENINLPTSYQLNGEEVDAIWNSSEPNVISTEGVVTQGIEDKNVTISLILAYKNETLTKNFVIKVPGIGLENFIEEAINTLEIPEETNENIILPKSFMYEGKKITTSWSSSNQNALSNNGEVGLIAKDTFVELTVTGTYDGVSKTKVFQLTIIALPVAEQIDYVLNSIELATNITKDLVLPTQFPFNMTGTWESSNPNILQHDGKIAPNFTGREEVTLILTLNTGDRREFIVTVSNINNHLILDRTFSGEKDKVLINDNGKLVLEEGAVEGYYTSEIYEVLPYTELVASWAAISSQVATVELLVRVRVNNVWSKYFSYGQWGLGLENKYYNQQDTVAKLSVDEVIINNNKKADALQFRAILRRNTKDNDSPEVSLLAAALNIPNYTYPVNIDNISKTRDYDVPKLNQNVVPEIGNIICSPTSSTMLLKFKGHDFTDKDQEYEHRYIARLLKDYGYGIYGNWVYNTVGMSAFGEISYVKRMYSYQELLHHLDTVGPIAASVKGTMIGEIGRTWTTSGHLIVVRGYRIENDEIYILANDPNMTNVYEEYKLQNFMNVWRNIAYVIE